MFDHPDRRDPRRDLWQAVLLTTVEDALNGAPSFAGSTKKTRIRLTKEARRYLTTPSKDLNTVCTLAGLDPNAVIDRMRKQIADAPSPEELIASGRVANQTKGEPKAARPRSSFSQKPFTINGKTKTAQEWCDQHGVNIRTAQSRVNNLHWSAEDALTTSIAQGKRQAVAKANATAKLRITSGKARRYEHDGHNLTLIQWAERTGLSVHAIRNRIHNYGWSVADALTTPRQRPLRATPSEEAA